MAARYPWRNYLVFLCPLAGLLGLMIAAPGAETEVPGALEGFHHTFPTFTWGMDVFSDYGNCVYYALYVLLLLGAVRRSKRKPICIIISYLICLVLALMLVEAAKMAVGRPRPMIAGDCNPFSMMRHFESFPSAHVAETLVTVAPLALFFCGAGFSLLLGLWPALMAFSRIYLGQHYPSDALGSLIIGSVGVVGVWCMTRLLCRYRRRLACLLNSCRRFGKVRDTS